MIKVKEEVTKLSVLMETIKNKYFGTNYDYEFVKDINQIIDNVTRIEFEMYREEKKQ